jgi:hypothetical protein
MVREVTILDKGEVRPASKGVNGVILHVLFERGSHLERELMKLAMGESWPDMERKRKLQKMNKRENRKMEGRWRRKKMNWGGGNGPSYTTVHSLSRIVGDGLPLTRAVYPVDFTISSRRKWPFGG